MKSFGNFIPKNLHQMKRYNSQQHIFIAEFAMPFEAKLDENHRWVVLSKMILWDMFAELYYRTFLPFVERSPRMHIVVVLGVEII
jgi:transposase, IS5 family